MCFAPDLIDIKELTPSQKTKLKKKLQQCKDLLQSRMKDVEQTLKKLERKKGSSRR
jgi:hypothetical protein